MYVVDRRDGKSMRVRKSRPNSICFENHLHEVKRRSSDGTHDYLTKNQVERRLGDVENKLAPKCRRPLDWLESGCLERGEVPEADMSDAINGLIALIAFLLSGIQNGLKWEKGQGGKIASELTRDGFLSDEDADELAKAGLHDELKSIVELSIMVTVLFNAPEGTKRSTISVYAALMAAFHLL